MSQASSHDPRNAMGYSRLGAPWGSVNVDFGNYLRQVTIDGRDEWVVLEDEGAGAVIRWWTTGINQGLLDNHHFRIYIDGSTTPAVVASAEQLVGGDNSGFGPALNFATPETGGNLYAPIVYREGVLITWDGPTTHGDAHVAQRDSSLPNSIDNALWYNINYREFPDGAEVASFTGADIERYSENLRRVNGALSELTPTGSVTERSAEGGTLQPGEALTCTRDGTGAIRRMQLRVTGDNQAEALADTYVVLTFDGQQTARIPAGEFFGNGLSESAENPYNVGADYMRSVAEDGTMLSLWVMPYERSAQVRIENAGGQPVVVALEVDSGDWDWDRNSMHFHADYVLEREIPTRQAPGGPWPGDASQRHLYSAEGDGDFRFIDIRGRGVFVGDTMSIRNWTTGGGLNDWWGEGDEKIYVDYLDANGDGSAGLPIHLGTGTEDYYGYSFGSGREFVSPFITQPNAAGNRGANGHLTVNGRVRGLDAIPFDASFKFDMEIWKWREGRLDIGAACFWYGEPGAASLWPVADLAEDFAQPPVGPLGQEPNADLAGDGQWQYLASDRANPSDSDANVAQLSWGVIGNQGNSGLGGGGNGENNLPAISNTFIYETGTQNIGVNGRPGYHEIHLHPGGDEFGGQDAPRDYAVARWVAGQSSEGLVNVSGSIRNLGGGGDSVDFYLYVNGELRFEAAGEGSTLPEAYFEFDTEVQAGDTVDFVLGNGGGGNPYGDESALRAVIRAAR